MRSELKTVEGDGDLVLALTNFQDSSLAKLFAGVLIETRRAACVNLIPSVCSLYRWHNGVEEATETLVLMKTQKARLPEIEAVLKEMHPAEIPAFLVLPVLYACPSFGQWIIEETHSTEPFSSL